MNEMEKKKNIQADLTRRAGPGTAHGGETQSFKREICSRDVAQGKTWRVHYLKNQCVISS